MKLWPPVLSDEMENVALPLLTVPVPSTVSPSLKVTMPVADAGETSAVRVKG